MSKKDKALFWCSRICSVVMVGLLVYWVINIGYSDWLSIIAIIAMILETSALYVASLGIVERSSELPQPLDEPIEADHGDSLDAVIDGIRSEPLEYLAVFTREGVKIGEGTLLNPSEANVSALLYPKRIGAVEVHNHPGLCEGSFSAQDFKVLFMARSYKSIVATRHHLYVLTNTNWRCASYEESVEVKAYADDILSNPKARKALSALPRIFFRWYTIYASYRTAKAFGLKFQVEHIWIEKFKRLPRKVRFVSTATLGAVLACVIFAFHVANLPTITGSALCRHAVGYHQLIKLAQETHTSYIEEQF